MIEGEGRFAGLKRRRTARRQQEQKEVSDRKDLERLYVITRSGHGGGSNLKNPLGRYIC